MRDSDSQPAEGMSAVSLILLFFGLAIVFIGLGLGLWLITIGYQALYHPEQVPLVGKVLTLLEKDDAFFEEVKTDTGVRYEGLGVRYGVLMLLLIVVLATLGSAIRGFITAGSSMMQAAMGKPPPKQKT
ncbi:MAG TPA: hypothetical protein VFV87_06735 [Pirellulaceae bacterium]|nr:hypothetical protein [Pirellulaceae bacterium]